MDFEEQLVRVIEQASSPGQALAAAVEAIAQDELSHACGIFLVGPEDKIALWARSRNAFETTRQTAEAVVRTALARVGPSGGQHGARAVIATPLLSRARAIGALLVERSADRPYAPGEVRRLVAIASHIVGVIENARVIDMIQHATEAAPLIHTLVEHEGTRGERVLKGVAASPGIAIGTCVFRQAFPRNLLHRDGEASAPDQERAQLRDAVEKTRNDLMRLEAAIGDELGDKALIFASHLLFLSDPMLLERVEQGIAAGLSAALAVDHAQRELVAKLNLVADPYIRERVEDLEDLCSRVLGHLLGASQSPTLDSELVVSRRTTPSLVVELHARGTLGIASELGGSASHAVLLARALAFPAVTGVKGLLDAALTGEALIVDGDEGIVILAPSARTMLAYRTRIAARERSRAELARYQKRVAVTADGLRFALRANVAFGADIELARANNAEGIGLYRTEIPFIIRAGIPTLEEQTRIYAKAYQAFPDHPVVFRILDLAADKLLPGSGLDPATSAFHGYRSIRLLFDHPHVLSDQVQAFALAAGRRSLSILIPMVSSLEELRRTKTLIAAALARNPDTAARPSPRIGVLIEVPAAVEIAVELARESDFISIGTNDLIQYALVVDRDDARLSSPLDAYHPAVLRMVHRVVTAAHAAGKEVSVCGEIAARFELAFALLALGVDSLSVTPPAIPELKQRLAQVEVEPLRRDMDRVLACATAQELKQAIRAHVDELD